MRRKAPKPELWFPPDKRRAYCYIHKLFFDSKAELEKHQVDFHGLKIVRKENAA